METIKNEQVNDSRTYQVGAATIAAGRKIQTEIKIGEDEIYITNYLNTKVNPASSMRKFKKSDISHMEVKKTHIYKTMDKIRTFCGIVMLIPPLTPLGVVLIGCMWFYTRYKAVIVHVYNQPDVKVYCYSADVEEIQNFIMS